MEGIGLDLWVGWWIEQLTRINFVNFNPWSWIGNDDVREHFCEVAAKRKSNVIFLLLCLRAAMRAIITINRHSFYLQKIYLQTYLTWKKVVNLNNLQIVNEFLSAKKSLIAPLVVNCVFVHQSHLSSGVIAGAQGNYAWWSEENSGEKSCTVYILYTCDQCEYAYSQSSNLKIHMKTHSG